MHVQTHVETVAERVRYSEMPVHTHTQIHTYTGQGTVRAGQAVILVQAG